jgi:hypothetical protein
MLLGDAPLGDRPFGDFDTTYSEAVADALEALLAEPWRLRSWWLRALPRDGAGEVALDLSTDGHKTFPTDAEEIQLPEALVKPYSVTFGLPANQLWGMAEMSEGAIVVGNRGTQSSFKWTYLADLNWVGRQAAVYVGPRGGRQAQFARVAQLITRQVQWDRSSLSLIVDDHGFLFDRQVQPTLYAGTGGLEGDDSIKGRPKPLLFGRVPRFEPVVVDGPNRIYQLNDGSMQAVDFVQDKGIALSFNANVADITASVPPAGTYNTSLATGYIRLGSTPIGTVTCAARGHAGSTYGYVDTAAGLVKLLGVVFAGLADPGELDGAAFAVLAAYTAVVGHYTGTEPATIRDVVNAVLSSTASWAWLRPDKVLTVGRLTDPDTTTPEFTLDSAADQIRISPWEIQPWEVPVWRVRVGFKRYWRVMSDSDLAGAVPEETRRDYAEEYRYVTAKDDATLADTPDAADITILTQLYAEADAQALADAQLALRKVPRRHFKFAPRIGLIQRGIGSVFELADDHLPTTPKRWVVVGVVNEAETDGNEDQIVWTCFG